MTSHTTAQFRALFGRLPAEIQEQARDAYRLFLDDPQHPSLRFKRVHTREPIYSARVGLHYRAVCVRDGDSVLWYWIGTHTEYERLLRGS